MLINQLVSPIDIQYSTKDGEIGTMRFPDDFFNLIDTEYIVLYFFPGDFTSICATEVLGFDRKVDAFRERGAIPVGCSINNPYVHNAWKQTPKSIGGLGTNISHPILSDISFELSKFFDVLIPKRSVATRGLFVINRDGCIVYESRSDTKTARNVSAIVELVADLRKLSNTSKRERTASQ
jgi:alkyl hydroperoxide reductase subunit AhpC